MIEKKILHRDIKKTNILLSEKHGRIVLKICDFGFSKPFLDERQVFATTIGTLNYMAPEVSQHNYTLKSDVFSLGVLFYQMLFRRLPFKDMKFVSGKYEHAEHFDLDNAKVSTPCKELLKRMIEIDEAKRISWDELERHSYLRYEEDYIVSTLETSGNITIRYEKELKGLEMKSQIANTWNIKPTDIALFYSKKGDQAFEILDNVFLKDLYIRKSTYIFVVPKSGWNGFFESSWHPTFSEPDILNIIHQDEASIPDKYSLNSIRSIAMKFVDDGFSHVDCYTKILTSSIHISNLWSKWLLDTNTEFSNQMNTLIEEITKLVSHYDDKTDHKFRYILPKISKDGTLDTLIPPKKSNQYETTLFKYTKGYMVFKEVLVKNLESLITLKQKLLDYEDVLKTFNNDDIKQRMQDKSENLWFYLKNHRSRLDYENIDKLTISQCVIIIKELHKRLTVYARAHQNGLNNIHKHLNPLKDYENVYKGVCLALKQAFESFQSFSGIVHKLNNISKCEAELERRKQWCLEFEQKLQVEHCVFNELLAQEDERRDHYDVKMHEYSDYIQQAFKPMRKNNMVIFDFEDHPKVQQPLSVPPSSKDTDYFMDISLLVGQLKELSEVLNRP